MNDNIQRVISLYNGIRTSTEIASIVGLSPRYVRKIATKHNLERLRCGARNGENNHQFVAGRYIDFDGYALIVAPRDHPYARQAHRRKIIYEHRLVMESQMGRYLMEDEIVHHIDELKLHNDPSNLYLFSGNGNHLIFHVRGQVKKISTRGLANMKIKSALPEDFLPVDIYRLRKRRGDVRLREILRAALQLGINNPYLSGTHQHLKKVGIDYSSRSTIKHALDQLNLRWELDLAR